MKFICVRYFFLGASLISNVILCDDALIKSLRSRYISELREADPIIAQKVVKSFAFVKNHDKHSVNFQSILDHSLVSQLFEGSVSRSCDDLTQESFKKIQYSMLLMLYSMLFERSIKSAESFLDDLITAKKYWLYEKFYLSQSFLRRHPVYNLYSCEYKELVNRKLLALEELENQIAHQLGMCLYGIHVISKFSNEDQLLSILCKAIKPLHEAYHVPFLSDDNSKTVRPVNLFQDLSWIYYAMQDHMHRVKTALHEHDQPSFLYRNWFGLTCCATASVVAYITYLQYQPNLSALKNKTQLAGKNVVDEYIVYPLKGLKEVLWDNKARKIQPLEEGKPLTHTQSYFIKKLGLDKDLDAKCDEVNENRKVIIKFVNNLVDYINEMFMKNQQVNLYLAAIGPVLIGGYLFSKYSKAGYNHFIKHEGWYEPMRYALRAVDRLINSVQRGNSSTFVDDGKLYMLVLHIKRYILCLSNPELMMMNDDLHDLLSFDLTYEQKHAVIERMYRTYQFLR